MQRWQGATNCSVRHATGLCTRLASKAASKPQGVSGEHPPPEQVPPAAAQRNLQPTAALCPASTHNEARLELHRGVPHKLVSQRVVLAKGLQASRFGGWAWGGGRLAAGGVAGAGGDWQQSICRRSIARTRHSSVAHLQRRLAHHVSQPPCALGAPTTRQTGPKTSGHTAARPPVPALPRPATAPLPTHRVEADAQPLPRRQALLPKLRVKPRLEHKVGAVLGEDDVVGAPADGHAHAAGRGRRPVINYEQRASCRREGADAGMTLDGKARTA